MLLMALYGVRSERQLCEQLQYNMMFRWFLDMSMTEDIFDASTLSKNRERFLSVEMTARFFDGVVAQARTKRLISDEHFSVDGTLIEAWASMNSYQKKDSAKRNDDDEPRPPTSKKKGWRGKGKSFRSERRRNQTHASKTDPEAKLYRKGFGKEAKLCFIGHVLSENRNGLIVDMDLTGASGTAEREAALGMIDGAIPGRRHRTLAADAGYHTRAFVDDLRNRGIRPHVAKRKYAAIDWRTTRVAGYAKSQSCRRIAEGINGWVKGVGRMAKTRFKGVMRSKSALMMYGAAYNR